MDSDETADHAAGRGSAPSSGVSSPTDGLDAIRGLLRAARALRAVDLTVARLGREGWRAAVREQIRQSSPSTPMTSSGMRSLGVETGRRGWVERDPAQIAVLERIVAALPAAQEPCPDCNGAQFVRVGPLRTGGSMRMDGPQVLVREIAPCPTCNVPQPANLIAEAGIPELYRDCTLASFPGDVTALTAVRGWMDAGPERSLVLSGAPGHGKTGLAIGIVQELCQLGTAARFVQVATLMQRARAAIATDSVDAVFDRYRTVPVVVLDDIAAVRPGWVQEQLPTLFEERRTAGLVTIITTDQNAREIEALYDTRFVSRLRECARITVGGTDLRGRAGA